MKWSSLASATTRSSFSSWATTAPAPKVRLQGTTDEIGVNQGVKESIPFLLSMIDELGGPEGYNHYPVGWAHAMDTPMQWTKQVASHFGGTRNGLVISWPAKIKDKGGLCSQFCHVIDIVPTIYQAAGITPPDVLNGVKQKPIEGTSLVYTFDNPKAPTQHPVQYFELVGNRAHLQGRLDGKHDSAAPAMDDDGGSQSR